MLGNGTGRAAEEGENAGATAMVRHIMRPDALVTHPDEILRAAADQMAEHWVGALPVVTRDGKRLLGILTEFDLLKARQRQLVEERHRERVLRLRRLGTPATGDDARQRQAGERQHDHLPAGTVP